MVTVNLNWLPTDALVAWIEAHLYYLPESVDGKGDMQPTDWAQTLHTLMIELEERMTKDDKRATLAVQVSKGR